MSNDSLAQLDTQYVGRDLPAGGLEIVGAEGDYLVAADGKQYLDFTMGWCVGNLGWGVAEIRQRIATFTGPDYVSPGHLYKGWAELAQQLAEMTPDKLRKSFRATGGTEAVEIALQAAMSHTKRSAFISIEGSYHGHSLGALSVGSSHFGDWYRTLLPDCHKIAPPLDDLAAEKVEKLLAKRDVAALIMEPIICNLGVIIPEESFMQRIQAACQEHGTLLIIDEVATGFGRTGKLFGSEHFNLEPDIFCLAKGITGGYGVLGATVMTDAVAASMAYDFSTYSTFGWHPRNVEAALAVVEYLRAHWPEIEQNVAARSASFKERLAALNWKYAPNIRIKGLAIGIEFEESGYADRLTTAAREHGLLCSSLGGLILSLFPALTIDDQTAEEGLSRLEHAIADLS